MRRHVGAGYWSWSLGGTLHAVSDNPYRLPQTVVPSCYRLVLEPDLAGATFAGTVSIDVTAVDDVESVALNADELEITSVRVGGTERPFHLEPDTERLIIDAPSPSATPPSTSTFTGTLNDKLRGWYRSTFIDDRRYRAGHRHDTDAGHRLPPRVPVLRRAGVQGCLRHHTRRRARSAGRLQRSRGQSQRSATTASTSSRSSRR